MCCHVRNASISRRRRSLRRQPPPLPPLAMLDLSKPGERQAHDFLCRATNKRDRMWELIGLRRHGDVLLCIVRWVHPDSATKTFSLTAVSLTEIAVHWWYFPSPDAAQAEMERRDTALKTSKGAA